MNDPVPVDHGDAACVEFLQWALPQLRLRWPGFRRVRGQVCKRIRRRMRALGMDSLPAYRAYLDRHPGEWSVLDSFCRISISRFCRDRGVFRFLESEVLPSLADAAMRRGESVLRVWSAGCGSGEEPYTLAMLWHLSLQRHYPRLRVRIVATDVSPKMIRRARVARYDASSLKELPDSWRTAAFAQRDSTFELDEAIRDLVELRLEDVRRQMPDERFDLILCRNLAFTYFEQALQEKVLRELCARLHSGGALVIGCHEQLPEVSPALRLWHEALPVYRKKESS